MPPAFAGNIQVPTAPVDHSSDHKLPNLRSLNPSAIHTTAALGGTIGPHVTLVHGDEWTIITGSEKRTIQNDQTIEIKGNEAHTTTKNLTYKIIGQTVDTRIGAHYQTNNSPRFETYVHTLTQDHHEKMIVHQPTTLMDIINLYFGRKWVSLNATGASFSATGTSASLTSLSGSGTVMSASNTVFSSSRESFSIKDLDIGLHVRGMITELKAMKLKAALAHLKAIIGNFNAGIAANMSSPFS
ncbi:MAG TPA: hypothetical protein VFA02_01690 [Pseudacidobacterium sp.]|nr:hypothetical protein [Pseudacidobacterium sp.]